MQLQHTYSIPKSKLPFSLKYHPHLTNLSHTLLNPYLGYPQCPLIGRYNKNQYKIADVITHCLFVCHYQPESGSYQCGTRKITIPNLMLYNLRNISEVIPHNKWPTAKKGSKIPQFHPIHFQPQEELSVIWIISFGELGKDFLNYLNHMYVLGNTLFKEQKLQRTVHYLPIYAYLPEKSGIMTEEVERGLCLTNYRSQYMSIHLKKGYPAFSPNNMRLGIEGMKKVVSSQPKQKQAKKTKTYIPKQQCNQKKKESANNNEAVEAEFEQLNWQLMENATQKPDFKAQKPDFEAQKTDFKAQKADFKIAQSQSKQINNNFTSKHQGYVHFYTSVLLENDYRVYYHWHIEDQIRQQAIRQLLQSAGSIQEVMQRYIDCIGLDEMAVQLGKILGIL